MVSSGGDSRIGKMQRRKLVQRIKWGGEEEDGRDERTAESRAVCCGSGGRLSFVYCLGIA